MYNFAIIGYGNIGTRHEQKIFQGCHGPFHNSEFPVTVWTVTAKKKLLVLP